MFNNTNEVFQDFLQSALKLKVGYLNAGTIMHHAISFSFVFNWFQKINSINTCKTVRQWILLGIIILYTNLLSCEKLM